MSEPQKQPSGYPVTPMHRPSPLSKFINRCLVLLQHKGRYVVVLDQGNAVR